MSLFQRTISQKTKVTGIGLHSGQKVTMKLIPAEAGTGIVFRRIDLVDAKPLFAKAQLVGATDNNTTLGEGLNVVHTVEHLLAALYGLGIENLICEIDGPEVPIMDGSSASFLFLIKEAGVKYLTESKKCLVVKKKIEVEYNGSWAKIEPAHSLEIDATIVFPHPIIKKQNFSFSFSTETFISEIGRARTFGLLRDVDMLKRKGLVKGGSLDNAIVMDDYKVLNPDGLRYSNEFVRHKILDIVGDIALLGYEIAGKLTAYKSGHKLHNLLCRKLLEDPTAYEVVSTATLKDEQVKVLQLPNAIPVSQ